MHNPFFFIENNFLAGRTFASWEDLNQQARQWCDKVNSTYKKHIRAVPRELFAVERMHLKPLPAWIPEVYRLHLRTVDVEGYVSVNSIRYSVPVAWIGHRVAPAFARYVDLKRALGRRFDLPARTLQSLDRFLCDQSAKYSDLNAAAFQAWCHTHEHVTSGVRRVRMLEVRSFCLYRRRTEPKCFVPNPSFFPPYHQRLKPYIFSAAEVGKLLSAAARLKRNPASPLRPELTRLAIVLLFTTGMRRGELLKLTLGDYDRQEATLHIRETKFYKSRLLPINGEIADEIERYLRVRARRRLPVSADTPLMWNATRGGRAYTGTGLRYCVQPLLEHCGITTTTGKLPRIQDLRHSFAVNALLRWYRAGADVEAKLPLLATYLGHGSVVSTHHYLHFIEPLRTAASKRFAAHYGELVSPLPQPARRRG